jgi:RNA polymerase sigma-70 factor (ECF subfamily)
MADAALAYADMEDAALAALTAAGDRAAVRLIKQRCNQRLFRVARALLGSDEEAEDVLQAAYLAAFARIDTFRGEAGLATWLTAITLNEARGRLRRRRPMLELTMLDEAPQTALLAFPGGGPADPETEAGRTKVRGMLEAAIDRLPPDFRLVFMLREVEGCSIEETATQLGIPGATVKTRHFRARRLLRRELEQQFAAGMSGAFPFLGARCDRICEMVLSSLG